MKKKRCIVKRNGTYVIQVAVLVVLSGAQFEKMECGQLEKEISQLMRKYNFKYAVEKDGNNWVAALVREYIGQEVDDDMEHNQEMDAINVMSEIDKLEAKCPSHEDHDETQEDAESIGVKIAFCRAALCHIEEARDRIPDDVLLRVPTDLFMEFCNLYISKYE